MATFVRVVALWLISFSFFGCYTQIRPPATVRVVEPQAEQSEPDVSERFEFYREHGRDPHLRLYDFGRTSFHDPFYGWAYADWHHRRSTRLLWQYGAWTTVYDPWWGYVPAVFVPVATHFYPEWVYGNPVDPPSSVPIKTRPKVRRAGFSGEPPSSGVTQARTVATSPAPDKPERAQESTKQAQKKKDDKEREEKREEKRSDQRRRGGMR